MIDLVHVGSFKVLWQVQVMSDFKRIFSRIIQDGAVCTVHPHARRNCPIIRVVLIEGLIFRDAGIVSSPVSFVLRDRHKT